jgi:hypothetical protein
MEVGIVEIPWRKMKMDFSAVPNILDDNPNLYDGKKTKRLWSYYAFYHTAPAAFTMKNVAARDDDRKKRKDRLESYYVSNHICTRKRRYSDVPRSIHVPSEARNEEDVRF